MFGLDDKIAGLSTGETFLIVIAVAILLGLRHATDPDHLTAVTTLVAGGEERGPRRAGRLGASWGLGHATSLFLFGVPIVLAKGYLPKPAQRAAELAVGLMIIALAIRLLLRWRRGAFHDPDTRHPRPHTRSPLQAYGIGVVHGIGGSAGVGILLLASIPDHVEALAALFVFSLFTAVSMSMASATFGYTLSRGPVLRRFVTVAPLLGALSLAFGAWYALGAVGAVPYGL
ncbi:MAG: HoxN/HupN/NixA family nickel/cobalt transporter [Thermoleophilaceae bacterium]